MSQSLTQLTARIGIQRYKHAFSKVKAIRVYAHVPVRHSTDREKAVKVVHLKVGVLLHEHVHRLVVVDRVPGANGLIRPADIMDHLPIVRWTCESC